MHRSIVAAAKVIQTPGHFEVESIIVIDLAELSNDIGDLSIAFNDFKDADGVLISFTDFEESSMLRDCWAILIAFVIEFADFDDWSRAKECRTFFNEVLNAFADLLDVLTIDCRILFMTPAGLHRSAFLSVFFTLRTSKYITMIVPMAASQRGTKKKNQR